MIEEEWRDVPGYEGLYQVSNFGAIKSFKRYKHGKIINSYITRNKYLMVVLCDSLFHKHHFLVHRLVGQAFIKNPLNLPEINHLDANVQNNNRSNLEWCTRSHNHKHKFKLNPDLLKGELHTQARISNTDALEIYNLTCEHKVSIAEIATRYNVSKSTVSCIKLGLQWSIATNKTYAKTRQLSILSENDVLEIYRLVHVENMRNCDVAEMYKVARNTISNIRNGYRWNNITHHLDKKNEGLITLDKF